MAHAYAVLTFLESPRHTAVARGRQRGDQRVLRRENFHRGFGQRRAFAHVLNHGDHLAEHRRPFVQAGQRDDAASDGDESGGHADHRLDLGQRLVKDRVELRRRCGRRIRRRRWALGNLRLLGDLVL